MTRHLVHVDAREHTEIRGREQRAAREHELSGLDVAARVTYVLAGFRDLDHDAIAIDARALDHHHRVGTRRHRRAGHDANRLARTDRGRGRAARGQLPHDAQGPGCVGGAYRVPVHARVGERRDRLAGDDVLARARARTRRGMRRSAARAASPRRGSSIAPRRAGSHRQRYHTGQRVATYSRSHSPNAGPRSARSSAISTLARRKSIF